MFEIFLRFSHVFIGWFVCNSFMYSADSAGFFFANYTMTFPVWTTLSAITDTTKQPLATTSPTTETTQDSGLFTTSVAPTNSSFISASGNSTTAAQASLLVISSTIKPNNVSTVAANGVQLTSSTAKFSASSTVSSLVVAGGGSLTQSSTSATFNSASTSQNSSFNNTSDSSTLTNSSFTFNNTSNNNTSNNYISKTITSNNNSSIANTSNINTSANNTTYNSSFNISTSNYNAITNHTSYNTTLTDVPFTFKLTSSSYPRTTTSSPGAASSLSISTSAIANSTTVSSIFNISTSATNQYSAIKTSSVASYQSITSTSTSHSMTPTSGQAETSTYIWSNEVPGSNQHVYYLTSPHSSKDLANNSLTTYLTLTTTDRVNVTVNITIAYDTLTNSTLLIVQSGVGLTVDISPLTLADQQGILKRRIVVHSTGCLHVVLYSILEDVSSGHVRSLSSTYIHPHMALTNDYLVVTPSTTTSTPPASTRLYIVSTADGNEVTIRFSTYPKSPIISFSVRDVQLSNPDAMNFTFNQSDVFWFDTEADLTGSRVTSMYPVAVFIGWKQTDGSLSFEQLTPAVDEERQFFTWPPLPYMSSLYRVSSGFTMTKLQVNNSGYSLPEAGDTCELRNAGACQVTADRPITGIQIVLNNQSYVRCLGPLGSSGKWRNAYTFILPTKWFKSSSQQPDLFLVIVSPNASHNQLVLDNGTFYYDFKHYVSPSSDYLFLIKRIGAGYHSISHISGEYFGVYLYGAHLTEMFCTTLGADHVNRHITHFDNFPIPGNSMYHYARTNVTPVPQMTVTSAQTTWEAPTSTNPPPLVASANLTSQQLEAVLGRIKAALHLNGKSLSAYTRRLNSAYDDRPLCRNIGCVGMALVLSLLLLLITGDVIQVCYWFISCIGLHHRWERLPRK